MGCDGGTIPRRDELVRTKKKPEQVIPVLIFPSRLMEIKMNKIDIRNYFGYFSKYSNNA